MGNSQSSGEGKNAGSTSGHQSSQKPRKAISSGRNSPAAAIAVSHRFSTSASTPHSDGSISSSLQKPPTQQEGRRSPQASVRHKSRTYDQMGNSESRLQDRTERGGTTGQDPADDSQPAREQSPAAVPVQVPGVSHDRRPQMIGNDIEPSGPPRNDNNYIPPTNFQFPPRLPLPIQEEVYTPGSPLISPADLLTSDIHEEEIDGDLPRRASLLSHTTVDEDDVDYEALGLESHKGKTVPTLVEWKQGGDRVYVTGTFASWSRKYRMHRNPDTNVLSTVLELVPGTHHVKFIVDGDMQLSNELPTAVDYTNILVNYIEVSADDIPKDPEPEKGNALDGVFPPQVLPASVSPQAHEPGVVTKAQEAESDQHKAPAHFGSGVPKYLIDLDLDEQSHRFQRAAGQVADVPPPASLPPFLNKSILNGTTPMKDDSSVLNMPNHTVLNHLATSSIKNAVLATTLTTRYKRKYVTTIMYRPTSTESD